MDTKEQIILEYLERGCGYRKLQEKYGISRTTICKWVQIYQGIQLHLHHSFDEFFCVLNGNFLFQVDDEILSLDIGDTLFIPRNVKHRFNYNGETSGTLLVSILPAKGMENYFAEMGKLLSGKGMPDMAALQRLFKSYNSEILGPPMK